MRSLLRPSRNQLLAICALAISLLPAAAQYQRGLSPATADPAAPAPNGSYYALVIGIDDYPAPLPKLKTAVADARAIAAVLTLQYGFQVQLLLDHNATRANILGAIAHYRDTLGSTDNLLLYYAGHGYSDHEADKAYWLPADADSSSSPYRIIADDLTSGIRVLRARHVLVISDSCYSGGLSRDAATPLRSSNQPGYINRMLLSRSRTLMASGGDEPVSDAGADGHSVFAHAILQALDHPEANLFTASDLFYTSVRQQVAGNARQLPEYSIIRDSSHDEGDFVFTRSGGQAATNATNRVAGPASPIAPSPAASPKPDQSRLVWTDPATNLMWTHRDNGLPVNPYQAATYCEGLSLGGFTDWRLPTIDELQQLYDPEASVRCIGLTCHINPNLPVSDTNIWSSTPSGTVGHPNLLFDYSRGTRGWPGNSFTNARALCVRTP